MASLRQWLLSIEKGDLRSDRIQQAWGWRPRRQSLITALRLVALFGSTVASAAAAPPPFTAPPALVWIAGTAAALSGGVVFILSNQAVDEALKATPPPQTGEGE